MKFYLTDTRNGPPLYFRREARCKMHMLAEFPHGAGDATPPYPKHRAIHKRRKTGDRMALTCGCQGEKDSHGKYHGVAVKMKPFIRRRRHLGCLRESRHRQRIVHIGHKVFVRLLSIMSTRLAHKNSSLPEIRYGCSSISATDAHSYRLSG